MWALAPVTLFPHWRVRFLARVIPTEREEAQPLNANFCSRNPAYRSAVPPAMALAANCSRTTICCRLNW